MATKTKAKAKRAPRKSTSKKAESQFPAAFVANHRFPPGTKVGFYPAATVEVERAAGREPFTKPTATATVGKDGSLHVTGLKLGSWDAAAEVGESWIHLQFSVKD